MRFPALLRVVALSCILGFVVALVGCGGGGGSKPSTPATVSVSPVAVSVQPGTQASITQQLTVTVKDSSGNALANQTVTFTTNNTSLADVSTGGLVCGGHWDSETSPVVCNAATPSGAAGPVATITVTSSGINASVPVFLHFPVTKVTVSPGSTDCQSAGASSGAETNTFTAQALSNGTDITNTVGPFDWTLANTSVGTVDITSTCSCTVNSGSTTCSTTNASCSTAGTCNSCIIKASQPGVTNVHAAVSGANSTPATFTTCPVEKIALHVKSATDTSVSLSSGGTSTLAVDVTDSKSNSLSLSSVAYNSSQPVTATVNSSTGVLTAANAGASTIVASCTPDTCNIGLYPVYSNPFLATVSGTSSSTAYAASFTGTSLIPIDTGTNATGTAVTLPNSPNSMVWAPNGGKLYLGVSAGCATSPCSLISFDPAANTVSTANGVAGKVLAVSPDSNTVIISDTTNSKLQFFTVSSSTLLSFTVAGGSHASWSPDGSHAYVAAGTNLIVFTPSNGALHTVGATNTVNDVDFLSQGSFAYLAGGPQNVSVYATCNSSEVPAADVATPARPALIRSLPNGTAVVAADSPNLDVISATIPDTTTGFTSGACTPPGLTDTLASFTFGGIASFTPTQLIVSPDSSKAFILAGDQASLLIFDVASTTPTTVALGNGATGANTGGVTLDGSKLYVGLKGANAVALYNVSAGTVTPISLSFSPDLVSVRPK